jgi:hypothetical protein
VVFCDAVYRIPNYSQQDATFLNWFIFTDVLYISGGSSTYHQEHIPVHNLQVLSTNTAASCYRERDGTNEYQKQYTEFTTTSFPAEYHIIWRYVPNCSSIYAQKEVRPSLLHWHSQKTKKAQQNSCRFLISSFKVNPKNVDKTSRSSFALLRKVCLSLLHMFV